MANSIGTPGMGILTLAEEISQATGLSPAVVADQLISEQGQRAFTGQYFPVSTNPFNLGPGYSYPSVEAGIQAYEKLIETAPQYAGIRLAIQSGNPATELEAIASSPFDASHYSGGATKQPGSALYENFPIAAEATLENPSLGVTEQQFTQMVKMQIATGSSNVGPGESPAGVVSGVGSAVSNLPGMASSDWMNIWDTITKNAETWFLYVILIVVGIIALIMLLGGSQVIEIAKDVVTK